MKNGLRSNFSHMMVRVVHTEKGRMDNTSALLLLILHCAQCCVSPAISERSTYFDKDGVKRRSTKNIQLILVRGQLMTYLLMLMARPTTTFLSDKTQKGRTFTIFGFLSFGPETENSQSNKSNQYLGQDCRGQGCR